MNDDLENGARPVVALGQGSQACPFGRLGALVFWPDARKSQSGRILRGPTRIAGCGRTITSPGEHVAGKTLTNKDQNFALADGAPRQLTPFTPASCFLRARLGSLPYPQSPRSTKHRKMENS